MKKVLFALLMLFLLPASGSASQMNLDPYFLVGGSVMRADVGGNGSTASSSYIGIGSQLNWISPHLEAEFRFGLGGQHAVFDGSINMYASYLLKPSFALARQLDIYGLLGMSTISATIAGIDSSDTALSYGLGFRYYIPNESLSIEGEWMQYHNDTNSSATNISGMSVSGGSIAVVFEYY